MFDYEPRQRAIIIGIIIGILALTTAWLIYDRSKQQDLEAVAKARILAESLERYYDKFNTYPSSEKISLEAIKAISEHGLNQAGNEYFYTGSKTNLRNTSYVSDGQNYAIDFELANRWTIWSISNIGGGRCRIINNVIMRCISE